MTQSLLPLLRSALLFAAPGQPLSLLGAFPFPLFRLPRWHKMHPSSLLFTRQATQRSSQRSIIPPWHRRSTADFQSIITYLGSVKPTITLVPVPHDSPGRVINLGELPCLPPRTMLAWKVITNVVTVSAPTKGTVAYDVANGFNRPTTATYTPFPGQSGYRQVVLSGC